jgi:hypothetical protein
MNDDTSDQVTLELLQVRQGLSGLRHAGARSLARSQAFAATGRRRLEGVKLLPPAVVAKAREALFTIGTAGAGQRNSAAISLATLTLKHADTAHLQPSITRPQRPAVLFCRQCGSRINPKAAFCGKCGGRLS